MILTRLVRVFNARVATLWLVMWNPSTLIFGIRAITTNLLGQMAGLRDPFLNLSQSTPSA